MTSVWRAHPVVRPLAAATAVGCATVALAVRDPHEPGSWGFCPLLVATGVACPMCGGLSATHGLATADFATAWWDNAYVVGWFLPLMVFLWGRWFWRASGRAQRPLGQISVAVLWAISVGGGLLFTVWRNLPLGAAFNPYFGTPALLW